MVRHPSFLAEQKPHSKVVYFQSALQHAYDHRTIAIWSLAFRKNLQFVQNIGKARIHACISQSLGIFRLLAHFSSCHIDNKCVDQEDFFEMSGAKWGVESLLHRHLLLKMISCRYHMFSDPFSSLQALRTLELPVAVGAKGCLETSLLLDVCSCLD